MGLLPVYRYALNPDATAYLNIAREYLAGEFGYAANGAFSPLLPWLITPLLALGVTGPLAARIVGLIAGALAIVLADRLARQLRVGECGRVGMRWALVPLVLSLAITVITGDLLATTLTLAYLAQVSNDAYLSRPGKWVLAGVFGALMYFAKAYAMWFFLGHLAVTHAVWLWQERARRGRVIAAGLVSVISFSAVAAPWVYALSAKYGHFTFNTTGRYNVALEAPNAIPFPPEEIGLLAPPNPMAVSAWEDTSLIPMPEWNPLASAAGMKHQSLIVARNFAEFLGQMSAYSVFALATGVAAAVVIWARRERRPADRAATVLLLAAAIYPAGYLWLHVEQRFLSVMAIVLLALGMWLVELATTREGGERFSRLAVWFLCLSFVPNALWQTARYAGGGNYYRTGTALKAAIPAGSRVASDGKWFESLYASYWADLRYFGTPRKGGTMREFEEAVLRHGVEYVLWWDETRDAPAGWQVVADRTASAPRVYRAAR